MSVPVTSRNLDTRVLEIRAGRTRESPFARRLGGLGEPVGTRLEVSASRVPDAAGGCSKPADAPVAANGSSGGSDLAELSKEERETLAGQLLELLNPPTIRMSNLMDDMASEVEMQHLRRDWCRHFKIEQFTCQTKTGRGCTRVAP